jgi:hypothetical protein
MLELDGSNGVKGSRIKKAEEYHQKIYDGLGDIARLIAWNPE